MSERRERKRELVELNRARKMGRTSEEDDAESTDEQDERSSSHLVETNGREDESIVHELWCTNEKT